MLSGATPRLWLPERGNLPGTGLDKAASVPAGVQSLLAQRVPLGPGEAGVLVVFSERARAMADREQGWVAAIANKLPPFVAPQ